jgi:tetratricopeptide (TPR) repeat protein
MSQSLLSYGFIERLKLGRALDSVTNKFGFPQTSREATQEAVKVLEVKVREKPREWIFWHALGDYYCALGDYAKAVRVCEKCNELRPRDPRSTYSLATALRMLTRARFLGHPNIKNMQDLSESGMSTYDDFDPLKSQQGLQELGLTVEQAAEKSLTLF